MTAASILLPTTDAGVAAQFAAVVAITVASLWLARRSRDVQTFVLGLCTMTIALMALRALH